MKRTIYAFQLLWWNLHERPPLVNYHLSKTPEFPQSYLEPFVNDRVSEVTATTFDLTVL